MDFIRDSWNVKGFLLVAIVAVAMVSLLIVFQKNFKDINDQYAEKAQELNETFDQLTGAQTQLNNTMEDLEIQTLKEGDLRDKYIELRTQKEILEAERNRLKSEVAEKVSEISSLDAEISSLEEDIQELNSRIGNLQSENDDLQEENSCLRSGGANC